MVSSLCRTYTERPTKRLVCVAFLSYLSSIAKINMKSKLATLFALLVASIMAMSAQGFAPASPTAFARSSVSPTALNVKIRVEIKEGENLESALRRFKRAVNSSGHLMELRHKRYFENSQERKKRKIKEMRLRRKFERMNRRRMNNRV